MTTVCFRARQITPPTLPPICVRPFLSLLFQLRADGHCRIRSTVNFDLVLYPTYTLLRDFRCIYWLTIYPKLLRWLLVSRTKLVSHAEKWVFGERWILMMISSALLNLLVKVCYCNKINLRFAITLFIEIVLQITVKLKRLIKLWGWHALHLGEHRHQLFQNPKEIVQVPRRPLEIFSKL